MNCYRLQIYLDQVFFDEDAAVAAVGVVGAVAVLLLHYCMKENSKMADQSISLRFSTILTSNHC